MNYDGDKNYVSVRFWMLAMFVMLLPCIGIIMVFVWAFIGENESRKNFFKAMLLWMVIIVAIYVVGALVQGWPLIQHFIQAAAKKN